MMLFRPVRQEDLQQIAALAQKTGAGLTTLPKDPEKLEKKIALSIDSFNKTLADPGDEYYLFVLEDTNTGDVVGTSALAAAVGLEQPFYTYKLGKTVHASPKLKVHKSIPTLILGHDYTGTTEICTLFLSPDHRGGGAGKLLSKARFLFLTQHPSRFSDTVIAEMRGYSDENGVSPFWESLGRHFFDMDFEDADRKSGEGTNEFIAELMPKYPIYVPLLGEEAEQVLGKVHPDTEPALDMLKSEGFEYKGYVDIFDAGPTIEVKSDEIDTIKRSHKYSVAAIEDVENDSSFLVANLALADFKAGLSSAVVKDEKITITSELAKALELKVGDTVIASQLR
ncbi:arginine N-succinyltransferase [Pleionea sp. CnH1-48]|uniref:arginine N-succinyltransferase n=1 Tax=Pleionea sp. CnH1-48 TaxID=2954494 RepID=UPI0020983784|nr:arginine N-succinyltransferase [Pleionea sp. CnH1-48]MCO7225405.1 arginine N-succinyltransferase [Pleionea sp. CnH1-48]